jgi:hypothetical protein
MASPSQHYEHAEHLLAAEPEEPGGALLAALVHALLAQTPRRARRVQRPARHASNGLPPHLTWGDKRCRRRGGSAAVTASGAPAPTRDRGGRCHVDQRACLTFEHRGSARSRESDHLGERLVRPFCAVLLPHSEQDCAPLLPDADQKQPEACP